jgi:hypothetical protein
VPHSSQFYRDEWAAKFRHPLQFDFNHKLIAGSFVRRPAHREKCRDERGTVPDAVMCCPPILPKYSIEDVDV